MKFAGARNMALTKMHKERNPLDELSLTIGKNSKNKENILISR
jgi:hypothetical protein